VAGHVDATAPLLGIDRREDDIEVTVACPETIQELLVPKGSIAVNGISLTIAALHAGSFSVRVIPHTWEHTNLRRAMPGELVNLEGDLLGKFVLRRADLRGAGGGAVTWDHLSQAGFL
jgi:riboflavin synthase